MRPFRLFCHRYQATSKDAVSCRWRRSLDGINGHRKADHERRGRQEGNHQDRRAKLPER